MPDFGARWRLVEPKPIGKGGQSHAYLVRDAEATPEKRYVAKLFNGPSDAKRRERLEREIAVCREFDHPNVVRFVDAGETETSKYPFLVIPFYEYGSLEDFKISLPNDPVEILSFFAKICDGVAHVHGKSIIHRDIKPANIFVGGNREPVVGDFGISFRDQGDRITERQEVAAPRWYGAPELRNGYLENPLPSADVYSLGKLLYWLFTGEVYDREEQDYGRPDRRLAGVLDRFVAAYSFVDQIIDAAVQFEPEKRKIAGAKNFAGIVARQSIASMLVGMCSIFDFHNAASSVGSEIIARRTMTTRLLARPLQPAQGMRGSVNVESRRIPATTQNKADMRRCERLRVMYSAFRAPGDQGWEFLSSLFATTAATFSISAGTWRTVLESTGYPNRWLRNRAVRQGRAKIARFNFWHGLQIACPCDQTARERIRVACLRS